MLKKSISIALVSSALCTPMVVNASALATSVVELSDLLFTYQDGGANVNFGDFSSLSYTSSADVAVSLSGTSNPVISGSSSNGVSLDLFDSIGAIGSYTDNDFAIISTAGGFPTGNFVIGDQNEFGAPITGIPEFDLDGNIIGTISTGAYLSNASYVSLENTGEGSAQTNNGLTSQFVFSGVAGIIDIDFDFSAYLETYLDFGDQAPSQASSGFSVDFLVKEVDVDGSCGFGGCATLLDEGIGEVSSSSSVGTGYPVGYGFDSGIPWASHVKYSSGELFADKTYELTARINTTADATYVPEPGILVLLGAGLIGFGARRKKIS